MVRTVRIVRKLNFTWFMGFANEEHHAIPYFTRCFFPNDKY